MEFSTVKFKNGLPVDAYGPGFFRVNGKLHDGNILIFPDGVYPWAGLQKLDMIIKNASYFDIIFMGMGADISPLPLDVVQKFKETSIMAEPMGTASACRTYNVLLSEGRRVALAALFV